MWLSVIVHHLLAATLSLCSLSVRRRAGITEECVHVCVCRPEVDIICLSAHSGGTDQNNPP